MSTDSVSPLRQRMIDRGHEYPQALQGHVQLQRIASFLKRPTRPPLRTSAASNYLHLAEGGVSICNRNRIMTGFYATVWQLDLAAEIYHIREPQNIPLVMSPDETKSLSAVASISRKPITIATGMAASPALMNNITRRKKGMRRSTMTKRWPSIMTGSPVASAVMVRQSKPGCKPGKPIRSQTMTTATLETDLKAAIRSIPDYPKPGIIFRDITTLLGDARAFRRAVDELLQPWAGSKIDKVAGIEARGFILGGAVAHQVSAGFVPIRKKGKLPFKRVSIGYSLEYGIDEMEMHEDAIGHGERVILVDDLIATGGTAEAACKLLKQIGANVLAACFIIDLPDLGGAEKIRKLGGPVRTLISFEGH
jgi:adenine phosphoribosyltransferase